jgi:Carboxypeptidase regulatory-like domain
MPMTSRTIRLVHIVTCVVWILSLPLASACKPGVPVVDPSPEPPTQNGTIAGSVSGPQGSAPAENRIVRAIALDTGQVYEARTASTGGYTIEVPPGRYKMELVILPTEKLLKQPGEIRINKSDLDPGRDFVIVGGGPGH